MIVDGSETIARNTFVDSMSHFGTVALRARAAAVESPKQVSP
jgi:hypothetical protein